VRRIGKRTPAEITAAEPGRPVDEVDRLVGPITRLSQSSPSGANRQNPAADSVDPAIGSLLGAGMEYLNIRYGRSSIEALDFVTASRSIGISRSRHDHSDTGSVEPPHREIRQFAVAGRLQCGQQI
jgi:hypothetical protein